MLLLGAEDLSWRGIIKGKEGEPDETFGCGDLEEEEDDEEDDEDDETTDRDMSVSLWPSSSSDRLSSLRFWRSMRACRGRSEWLSSERRWILGGVGSPTPSSRFLSASRGDASSRGLFTAILTSSTLKSLEGIELSSSEDDSYPLTSDMRC